jgi:signal transduction histidine kinase
MLNHVALNKNVDLVVELSEDHQFYFRQIYGDERRFMQVIINLLSNSLKFSNKGT